jgi:hypothetical protein
VYDATMMHELDPLYTVLDLLLVGLILAQIVVLIVRRSAGQVVPDHSGWERRRILDDLRLRLGLGLLLAAAWAGIAIALVRHALQPGVMPLLASHLGALPLPPWLAFVLQSSHQLGLMSALWATSIWLDRSISKYWSEPTHRHAGLSALSLLLALFALAASMLN